VRCSASFLPLALAIALSLPASVETAAQTMTPEEARKGIERRYNKARTLEADFVQRYTLGAQTLVESGRVYFQKPGRMRWEYDRPAGKLFLADGQYAYLYLPSEQLVRRQPLKESGEWQTAFALLLGRVRLGRFLEQIALSRVYHPQSPALWQLRGRAKSDRQPFEEIWMDLNEGLQLLRIEIQQRDGSLMEFHFRNWKENQPLASDLFLLQVPPGTAWIQAE
jgi:outer membrane lipoprotein carrier protein